MKAVFKHIELKLLEPAFDSNLMDVILELEHLRKKELKGTTDPDIFFQLKKIFHFLESIGSARIEGNRTTITEFIEAKIDNKTKKDEKIIEIDNMAEAHTFIDDNIGQLPIDRKFVSEIHKIIVQNLVREGSKNPGDYRKINVAISKSSHIPPDMIHVAEYMDELFTFFNNDVSSKYDLLKTAIAHHRFAWIHPFDDGNGRTARLLTYAMLVKQDFNIKAGRIINPTAIFCINRDRYYNFLSKADSGKDKNMLAWCEYVLIGLKNEIDKIDKLLDYHYLSKNILFPMVKLSLEKRMVTSDEAKILNLAIKIQIIQAADIKNIFPEKAPAVISRMIGKLKKKKMLMSEDENKRKYLIRFDNNYLLRSVIYMLDKHNFISIDDF